jgi:hypothetical protein
VKTLNCVLTLTVLFSVLGTGMIPFPAPQNPLEIFVDQTGDPPGYQSCTGAPTDCSLRGAITLANSTINTVDTIIVPAGTYTLSLTGIDDTNLYGDLDIWAPVTIIGAGSTTTFIQSSPSWDTSTDRVMHIFNWEGTVTITDLALYNGKISSGAGGAGIYQSDASSRVVLERVMISDNHIVSSVGGAGILAKGNLTIIDSTIEENNTFGEGGGIYGDVGSQLTITRSMIGFNYAYRGGGMMVFDDAVLRNVTLNHNSVSLAGGSISQWDDSVLTLYNTTLNGSHISVGPLTGWEIENYGSVSAYASIFAAEGTHFPCLNNNIAGFSNLSTNNGCGLGFIVADPLLGNLGINGGYTQTCSLLPGSPAIDGGDNSFCLLEDQRGIIRPLDGDGDGVATCDIGAVEMLEPILFLPLIRRP